MPHPLLFQRFLSHPGTELLENVIVDHTNLALKKETIEVLILQGTLGLHECLSVDLKYFRHRYLKTIPLRPLVISAIGIVTRS